MGEISRSIPLAVATHRVPDAVRTRTRASLSIPHGGSKTAEIDPGSSLAVSDPRSPIVRSGRSLLTRPGRLPGDLHAGQQSQRVTEVQAGAVIHRIHLSS